MSHTQGNESAPGVWPAPVAAEAAFILWRGGQVDGPRRVVCRRGASRWGARLPEPIVKLTSHLRYLSSPLYIESDDLSERVAAATDVKFFDLHSERRARKKSEVIG